jgi:hypothetical protein
VQLTVVFILLYTFLERVQINVHCVNKVAAAENSFFVVNLRGEGGGLYV